MTTTSGTRLFNCLRNSTYVVSMVVKLTSPLPVRYSQRTDLYLPKSMAKIRSAVAAFVVLVIASSVVGVWATGCVVTLTLPHTRSGLHGFFWPLITTEKSTGEDL